MRGRKPLPTALKHLHGVELRRINQHEPTPEHGLPSCPLHFTPEQAGLWDDAVRCAPSGMLRALDVGLLEAWCVAYSIHRAATVELAQEGAITVRSVKDRDRRVAAPQIGIINRAGALMARLAADLGFSPSARSRVQVASIPGFGSVGNDASSTSLDDYIMKGEQLRTKVQAKPAAKHS
jgi:P27 family predicted phage terminase small subunit